MKTVHASAVWLVALLLTPLLSFGQTQAGEREQPSFKVDRQGDNSYIVATGQRISPAE